MWFPCAIIVYDHVRRDMIVVVERQELSRTPLPASTKVSRHIVWNIHRTSNEMYFDSLTLDGKVNAIKMVERSGSFPKG
jgi:hypothetical protein